MLKIDSVKRKAEKAIAYNHNLSKREMEVFQQMANGLSIKQIAGRLGISIDTVESHRKSIHKKLKVNSAVEAIAFGFRNRILK